MIIISRTPLRISFVGGGTDIRSFYAQSAGAVLSTAIDKYIDVIVRERKDNRIGLYYDKTELVSGVDQIRHELIREALIFTRINGGVDILVQSEVSSYGTGLGSSSSLVIGLLTALFGYQQMDVDREELARMACHIEIEVMGSPIGKQDQYAAAYGGLNLIRFRSDETVKVEPITLPESLREQFFKHMLMVNTGLSRKSSEVLKDMTENMGARRNYLKAMAEMPEIFRDALVRGNFDETAKLLQKAWHLKKQAGSLVSNLEIDQIHDIGLQSGASAGKLLGAGAGGYMLFLVPLQKQDRFLQIMTEEYEVLPVGYSQQGSRILHRFR